MRPRNLYSFSGNGVHIAIQQMDSCPSIASLSHSLPFLNSHLKMACQHPACLDHWSCPRTCTPFPHLSDFSFSSHFLSSVPITTHFCLWPYTASSPLSTSLFFFPSSLAMFFFFFFPHFKPEGKWAVTSVAGTRTSPVAREEPAPVWDAAKPTSQGRIFTSPHSSSPLHWNAETS